jgi:hypothetical protein
MTMRIQIIAALAVWLVAAATLLEPNTAWAQEATAQPASTEQPPPAAETPDQAAPPAAGAPTPLPGPEVMRTSGKGLRLTPAMVQGVMRNIGAEWKTKYNLTQEQRGRFELSMTSQVMKTARAHEEQWQEILEYGFDTLLKTKMGEKFTPETSREFGQHIAPAGPLIRELLQGMHDEAAPILTPEQRKQFDADFADGVKELDKFDAKMKRWAEGGYKPGERFDDTNEPKPDAKTDEPPKPPELQRAEQTSNWMMTSMLEPMTWETFARSMGRLCKFDTDQTARADKILADYKAKADVIMTPEWKERMRQNRIQQQLRNSFDNKQPSAPWFYHLEYEFNEAQRPLNELGRAFRKDIMAVATEAQRQAVIADLQARASEFGLTIEEADQVVLGLKPE